MDSLDYSDVEDFRRDIAKRCLGIGLQYLSKAALESNDPGEIVAAAELDVIEGGVDPAHAWRAVSAGALVYQLSSVLKRVGEISLSPHIQDYQ